VAEEGGFTYHSDSYSDDLPYYEDVGGPGTKPQLVVPYTFDANDQKFVSPNAFSTGEEFRAYLQETFDALYTEGANGAPKMMSIGLHCRLAGTLNRDATTSSWLRLDGSAPSLPALHSVCLSLFPRTWLKYCIVCVCHRVGRPARAAALAEFVDYVRSLPNVWLCTRLQIAEHWLETFPPPPPSA
jgi:hypothetical protein